MATGTIQISKIDTTAMLHPSTGHINIVSNETEELFNKCHDAAGKFCPGGGGSGGDGEEASLIKAVGNIPQSNDLGGSATAARKNRNATLIKIGIGVAAVGIAVGLIYLGSPVAAEAGATAEVSEAVEVAKTARGYETIAKDGRALHVIDHTGQLSEPQAKELLSHLNSAHERSPLPGKPPRIEVQGRHEIAPDVEAFVVPQKGARTIHINSDNYFSPEKRAKTLADLDKAYPGRRPPPSSEYFMPSYYKGGIKGQNRNLVFHEYGHLHEIERMPNLRVLGEEVSGGSSYNLKATRVHSSASDKGLSLYGRFNSGVNSPREGYAEAFSEYHSTSGRTTNRAAREYAQEYGWNIG